MMRRTQTPVSLYIATRQVTALRIGVADAYSGVDLVAVP